MLRSLLKNGGSPITTHPVRKTIKNRVLNFRKKTSAPKRKSTGRPKTTTKPENVTEFQSDNFHNVLHGNMRLSYNCPIDVFKKFCIMTILRSRCSLYYRSMITEGLSEKYWEIRTTLYRDFLRNVSSADGLLFYGRDTFSSFISIKII